MKRKILISLALLSLFVVALSSILCVPSFFAKAASRDTSWVPTEGSYVVENSMLKLQSDSGYDGQGPETIVDGFNKMQAGNPDFIWYGEYEYVSIDGGATWHQLPSVRTLTEITAGQEYVISFDTSGTPLAALAIDKRVAIVTGPDAPLARIEYSITSTANIPSALLYYAIDYCDEETTGDATDNVYDFTNTQILTAQWFTGINGLYVDTLASGFGVIETTYPADYYAGDWDDALYMLFGTGYNIDTQDDGIGVRINLGELLDGVTVVKDLYIGIYQAGEPPPSPEIPVASFTEDAHSVLVDTTINFDASGSYDLDGTIVLYEWDWESDGTYDFASTEPTASHTYSVPGTYTVTLKVTDNDGQTDTAEDTKTILTEEDVHDVEAVSQTVTENTVLPGDMVDIYVTVHNPGDFTESFDLTCYYDSVEIGTVRVIDLAPGEVRVVTFTWDTTGVQMNGYPITAWADSSMEIVEIDEANNECIMPLGIFVIPELPFGTILATLSMFVALIGFVWFKRFRPKRRLQ